MDKYIKCDEELIDKAMAACSPYTMATINIKELLENYPSSNVREVVRCDECEYGEADYGFNGDIMIPFQYRCEYEDTWNRPDHYCSYGKKKEGAV